MAAALLAFLLAAQAPAILRETVPDPVDGLERARIRPESVLTITENDYPPGPTGTLDEGVVIYRLEVGVDGRPTGCAIVESSGHAHLDKATCRLAQERLRFDPARDKAGKAAPDTHTGRMQWRVPPRKAGLAWLPGTPIPPVPTKETLALGPVTWPRTARTGSFSLSLDVSREGLPTACRMIGSSGDAQTDAAFCRFARARFRFAPARDVLGRPVEGTTHFVFFLPERKPAK